MILPICCLFDQQNEKQSSGFGVEDVWQHRIGWEWVIPDHLLRRWTCISWSYFVVSSIVIYRYIVNPQKIEERPTKVVASFVWYYLLFLYLKNMSQFYILKRRWFAGKKDMKMVCSICTFQTMDGLIRVWIWMEHEHRSKDTGRKWNKAQTCNPKVTLKALSKFSNQASPWCWEWNQQERQYIQETWWCKKNIEDTYS